MSSKKTFKIEETKLLARLKENRLVRGVKTEMLRLIREVADKAPAIETKLEEMRTNLLKSNRNEFQYGSATNEKESRYEKRIPIETVSRVIDVPLNELMLYFLNGVRLCHENHDIEYRLGCVHFYSPRHENLHEAMTPHERAVKKGLISKGWGRYADQKTGRIVAKTDNGKLVPVKKKSNGVTGLAAAKKKTRAKQSPEPQTVKAPNEDRTEIPEYGSVVIPADQADQTIPAMLSRYMKAGKKVTINPAAGENQGFEVFFEPQTDFQDRKVG